jgi:hypothetical protein
MIGLGRRHCRPARGEARWSRDGPVAPLRKPYQSKGLANHRWTKIHWQVNNPGHQR